MPPQLFIIALSGRSEARQNAQQAGADAFVSKVDPPEHLLTAIKDYGANRAKQGPINGPWR